MSFTRALRIAKYNWPLYVTAGAAVAAGTALAFRPEIPVVIRGIGGAGAAIAGWFACASFMAFHAMFDRSELLDGKWVMGLVPEPPRTWVQINAGLEETTLPLDRLFAVAQGKMLDLNDPAVMTEPAVSRARRQRTDARADSARPDALPVENDWADLVVVTLAAHEIRDPQLRDRFFEELRRVVSPQGRVIVVEHLRDLAAALAFGPGFFHFLPRGEWLRLGKHAGFDLQQERSITPFVRVFVYRLPEPQPGKRQ